MPPIFGRDAGLDHPLEARLGALADAAFSHRCVVATWRHDWRVCPAREDVAVNHLCGAHAAADLRACYGNYHDKCICHGKPCEYCDTCNSDNLLPGGTPRKTELCRVICLNMNSFRAAAAESLPEARGEPDWDAWLDRRITEERLTRGVLGVRDLLANLFGAWNDWSKRDQRPAWASAWADILPLLDPPAWADRLRDAFGLGMIGARQWLVLLRYQLGDVGKCYRPTCLDAGWHPWHVLSPPGEPFGFAMDLSPVGGRCRPEVIHAPIPLEIAQWTGLLRNLQE